MFSFHIVTNVEVVNASIIFPNVHEIAISFSSQNTIAKTSFKVTENDLANSCKNEWDLVDYRDWGKGIEAVAAKGVPALRAAYVSEVEGLSSVASKMRAAGSSSEEIARTLHGLRRELGVKYKSLTPDNVLQQIYQRNLQKYGDKLGPTIDYLRQQGKSWDDIINSATRTGGKDLGF